MRYAVRHEYAQTAVDVLARRTRLSFLNAQAALDALPRVVDIMAEELHWTRKQKQAQIESAVEFLASMGLPPGSVVPSPIPQGIWENVEGSLSRAFKRSRGEVGKGLPVYSRAQFEAGEIDMLKNAFTQKAGSFLDRLKRQELVEVLKEVPGYDRISPKDCDYVLEEAGFKARVDIDFDEFIEVSFFSLVNL